MAGAFSYKSPSYSISGIARYFPVSTVYVVPQTGIYRIDVVGAGGCGGVSINSGFANSVSASGGGGGGYAMKEVLLAAGTRLTITIGAGGAYAGGVVDGVVNGNNGGLTTVTGCGTTVGATGGLGGTGYYYSSGVDSIGGAGGMGFGGDLNYRGGAGGNGYYNAAPNNASAGGGGSSGSPYGDGFAGAMVSGGGGGGGGGVCQAGVSSTGGGTAVGGTVGRNAMNIATNSSVTEIPNASSTVALFTSTTLPLLCLTGGAVNGAYSGPGAGGCGTQTSLALAAGGVCGGGGGFAGYSTTVAYMGGSKAGGGSGGIAMSNCASPSLNGASGGNGLVIIERVA